MCVAPCDDGRVRLLESFSKGAPVLWGSGAAGGSPYLVVRPRLGEAAAASRNAPRSGYGRSKKGNAKVRRSKWLYFSLTPKSKNDFEVPISCGFCP